MNLKLLYDKILVFTSGENGARVIDRNLWRGDRRNHLMKVCSGDVFLGIESEQLQLLMAISMQRSINIY